MNTEDCYGKDFRVDAEDIHFRLSAKPGMNCAPARTSIEVAPLRSSPYGSYDPPRCSARNRSAIAQKDIQFAACA